MLFVGGVKMDFREPRSLAKPASSVTGFEHPDA